MRSHLLALVSKGFEMALLGYSIIDYVCTAHGCQREQHFVFPKIVKYVASQDQLLTTRTSSVFWHRAAGVLVLCVLRMIQYDGGRWKTRSTLDALGQESPASARRANTAPNSSAGRYWCVHGTKGSCSSSDMVGECQPNQPQAKQRTRYCILLSLVPYILYV